MSVLLADNAIVQSYLSAVERQDAIATIYDEVCLVVYIENLAVITIAVENEVADNMYQRSEMDWLIYNKPLEYAQLVLSGDLEQYVQGTPEHRLMD